MAPQKRISIRRMAHRMDEITKLTAKDALAPDLTVEGIESGCSVQNRLESRDEPRGS